MMAKGTKGRIFEKLGEEMEAASRKEGEKRVCPKCGSNMVKRNGIYGTFFGCSSYPVCKHTENAYRQAETGSKRIYQLLLFEC